MAEEKKEVRYDIDGFDIVTDALLYVINNYPGIPPDEEVAFSTLDENSGISMFPVSGAIIETEKEDITGHVVQVCLYPFYVIYRAGGLSEARKAAVKEWLENLGKYLELQEITADGHTWKLDGYPALTGDRKFLTIVRQTPGYLDSTNENMSENWAINIAARYQNEFNR